MTHGEGGTPPRRPPSPYDSGIEVRIGPRTSGPYQRRRERVEQRRTAVRGAVIAGTAAVTVAAAAVGLYFLRDAVGSQAGAQPTSSAAVGAGPVAVASQGPPVNVTTAQGDAYSMSAVTGGGAAQGTTPAPSGQTYAYADYVLTNTLSRQVLLNLPADLFVRSALVPENLRPRCVGQSGVPQDMCSLPNTSKVIGYVNDSMAPEHRDGDDFMPPHASYLVRITTQLPIAASVTRQDLGVFVWNALYVPDQQARPIAFP